MVEEYTNQGGTILGELFRTLGNLIWVLQKTPHIAFVSFSRPVVNTKLSSALSYLQTSSNLFHNPLIWLIMPVFFFLFFFFLGGGGGVGILYCFGRGVLPGLCNPCRIQTTFNCFLQPFCRLEIISIVLVKLSVIVMSSRILLFTRYSSLFILYSLLFTLHSWLLALGSSLFAFHSFLFALRSSLALFALRS